MARETGNPGKTDKHYRKNAKSRLNHIVDNSPGGKYAHTNAYKRKHAKLANVIPKLDPDLVKRRMYGKIVN